MFVSAFSNGFSQKQYIDYFETFALLTRISSISVLLVLTSIHKLVIHQADVKTVFLNGDSVEEIYATQLEGCVISGQENKTCKLLISLYDLKQALK